MTIVALLLVAPRGVGHAETAQGLTSEQLFSTMSACALNVDLRLSAQMKGSLKSLFEGVATNGQFSIQTTSEFLQLFPLEDKLRAYRAYKDCMLRTLGVQPLVDCTKSATSNHTTVAVAPFSVDATLHGKEALLAAALERQLRLSRQYRVVMSEQDKSGLESMSSGDVSTSVRMLNNSTACLDRPDVVILSYAQEISGRMNVIVKRIDTRTSKLTQVGSVSGAIATPDQFEELMKRLWRKIEGGFVQESRIWANGAGFCQKLRAVIDGMRSVQCAGDDFAERYPVLEMCASTWNSYSIEPSCLVECRNGVLDKPQLYARLNGETLGKLRSRSEQQAFVDNLKRRFGYTDQELAKVNIKPLYEDDDLDSAEVMFDLTFNDLHSCLADWTVEGPNITHPGDREYKRVSFAKDGVRVLLEWNRWLSHPSYFYNFLGLYFQ